MPAPVCGRFKAPIASSCTAVERNRELRLSPFGKCSPRPVQAYRRIVGGYLLETGKVLNGFAANVDLFDGRTVFAFEILYRIADTGADRLREFRFIGFRRVNCELLVGSCSCGASPKMICNRITENSIDPRYGTLAVANLRPGFHCLQIGQLKDLFGCCRVFHMGRKEAQELVSMSKDPLKLGVLS